MELQESQRRAIMQQYPGFYRLTAVVILIGVGILIGWILFADKDGYGMNLFTEFVGVGFTFLILDWWVKQRETREAELHTNAKLKADLIAQLRSRVNDEAKRAAEELSRFKWLHDGSLYREDLSYANLSGAYLMHANLHNTILSFAQLNQSNLLEAKLLQASLVFANLRKAFLMGADLRWANFTHANFQEVQLSCANLLGADLRYADLRGADLSDASLLGAKLDHTRFDENTVLPNRAKWTPETQLECFLDEGHPDYQASENPLSPTFVRNGGMWNDYWNNLGASYDKS